MHQPNFFNKTKIGQNLYLVTQHCHSSSWMGADFTLPVGSEKRVILSPKRAPPSKYLQGICAGKSDTRSVILQVIWTGQPRTLSQEMWKSDKKTCFNESIYFMGMMIIKKFEFKKFKNLCHVLLKNAGMLLYWYPSFYPLTPSFPPSPLFSFLHSILQDILTPQNINWIILSAYIKKKYYVSISRDLFCSKKRHA